jgi:hypothetical protein
MITRSPVLNVTVATIKILPIQPVLRLPLVRIERGYNHPPGDPRDIANALELLGAVESE